MRMEMTWAGVALAALVACAPDSVAQPPAPPVNWHSFDPRTTVDAGPSAPTEKERALVVEYVAALASPGFAQLAPLVDDDAHFSFPGMDDAHGRNSIVHAHEVLLGAFDQRRFVTTRAWRTASEQTIEWTMAGIQTHDWMRVTAAQKPVAIRGVTLLWTKDDGSIADLHVYFDVAAVKAQLGMAPKGLAPMAVPSIPTGPPQIIDQNGQDADNVRVVRTELDALENNEGMYLNALTDDVEVYTLERPDPARGKEDARAYFKAMHKAIAQLDTTIDNGWDVAKFAIVEYTIAGEQLAPLGWVPAQRDSVIRLHVVDVDELRDGRIARVWRYDNPIETVSPGP
jgi:ketosteroid isomerase-like protein